MAGSDSGGGAGIQADIKTITALGGYAMSALTALTAQNTVSVSGVLPVSPDFIRLQILAVADDIGVDVVKTGMLLDAGVVELVADIVRSYPFERLVVDPVMVSKSGVRLLSHDAEAVIKSELLPLAEVVTPNLPEASALSGLAVEGIDQMREAARRIADLGPRRVVIKGGHIINGPPVNLVYDGTDFTELRYERINTTDTHGTGCTFASAVAVFMGFGLDATEAVSQAGEVVHRAIKHSYRLGRGHGPLAHSAIACRHKNGSSSGPQ